MKSHQNSKILMTSAYYFEAKTDFTLFVETLPKSLHGIKQTYSAMNSNSSQTLGPPLQISSSRLVQSSTFDELLTYLKPCICIG